MLASHLARDKAFIFFTPISKPATLNGVRRVSKLLLVIANILWGIQVKMPVNGNVSSVTILPDLDVSGI
jgi:hypothetical protein